MQLLDYTPFFVPLLRFAAHAAAPEAAGIDNVTRELRARIAELKPQLPTRSNASAISEEMLQTWTGQDSLLNITSLNLHGQAIRRVEPLAQCANLESLVLSCNEVQKIEGLGGLAGLTFLDLSFNKIKRVTSMGVLQSLISLNMSYNLIAKLEDVSMIKQQRLDRLEVLDLRGNAACEAHNYRTKALQYLADLCGLDGQRVKDTERQSAATKSACLDYGHVAEASQATGLAVVWERGSSGGGGSEEDDEVPEWAELVQALSVNYEHLNQVKIVEGLPNLRKVRNYWAGTFIQMHFILLNLNCNHAHFGFVSHHSLFLIRHSISLIRYAGLVRAQRAAGRG